NECVSFRGGWRYVLQDRREHLTLGPFGNPIEACNDFRQFTSITKRWCAVWGRETGNNLECIFAWDNAGNIPFLTSLAGFFLFLRITFRYLLGMHAIAQNNSLNIGELGTRICQSGPQIIVLAVQTRFVIQMELYESSSNHHRRV